MQPTAPLPIVLGAVHGIFLDSGFLLVPTAENNNQEVQLPAGWQTGPALGLHYRHPRSSLRFELKLVPIMGKVYVHAATTDGSGKVLSKELEVDQLVGTLEADGGLSNERLSNLAYLVRTHFIHQLAPGLKEGYEPAPAPTSVATQTTQPQQQQPQHPRYPPNYLEDDDDDGGGYGLRMPGRRPFFGVGQEDLVPPGLGGFGGFGPGGMVVGPNHPSFMMGRGRGRGRGGLPPGVPPGARFDPYGPFGGEPDFDDFPPPGQGGFF